VDETLAFDAWQVDASVFLNADAVSDDSQASFFERTRARHKLTGQKSPC